MEGTRLTGWLFFGLILLLPLGGYVWRGMTEGSWRTLLNGLVWGEALAVLVVASLMSGETSMRGLEAERRTQPWRYWGVTVLYLMFYVAVVGSIFAGVPPEVRHRP